MRKIINIPDKLILKFSLVILGLLTLLPVAYALLGDVNQDTLVDQADADQVLEAVVGTRTFGTQQQADADVDDTGIVDSTDAMLIDQFAAGQISGFPARNAFSSSPIQMRRDGSLLAVVNPDNNSVSFLDPTTQLVLTQVTVGGEPASITFSRNGLRAYVTNSRDRTVSIIDTTTFGITNTLAVGVEPNGIVINNRGDRAYVANLMSESITVIDVRTESVVDEYFVGEKPIGLAISADSAHLYVTHLNGPIVSHVALPGGAVTEIGLAEMAFDALDITRPAGVPTRLKGLAIHPATGEVWVPHILSNIRNLVETIFNSTVFPAISVINTATLSELPAARMTLFAGIATSISSPEGIAFSPDGALAYVVASASNDLVIFNTATRQQVGLIRDVGDNPRGLVTNSAGTEAYVFNRLSPVMSIVDLVSETVTARISTANRILPANIDNGRRLFFTSASTQTAQDRFMSCESCHFDGRDDGQTWVFSNGPRQTIGIMGGSPLFTGLMHHNGDRANLQDFAVAFTRLQGGTGLTANQLNDLADFANVIRMFDNPHLNPDGSMTASARAGRQVFKQAGCALCHSGPFLTDAEGHVDISNPLLHNVGIFAEGTGTQDAFDHTRDQDGVAGGTVRPAGFFETTFLLGVFATPPYLHDGRAATLLETLTTHNPNDQHGVTSTLSAAELNQLVAYMQQLDIRNARVRIQFPVDGSRVAGLTQVRGAVLPGVNRVDVYINSSGPIPATVSNGQFIANISPAQVPVLSAGTPFDISARALTGDGEPGRDDIEVIANLGETANPANSTLSANPNLIRANGSASSAITITPMDNAGQRVGSGLSLLVQSNLGSVGPVTDNGDGTYRVTLTAGTAAGVATVTARQSGGPLFNSVAQVEFTAGDVSAATSQVSLNVTNLEADAIGTAQVTVTPRDPFGNLLGSGASIMGSVTSGALSAFVDQTDGTYVATYTASTAVGTATLTIVVNGTTLALHPQISLVVDVTAPDNANLGAISFGAPVNGVSQITGGAGAVESFATVRVSNQQTGQFVLTTANADGSFSVALTVGTNQTVQILVSDITGNNSTSVNTIPFVLTQTVIQGIVQSTQSDGSYAPVAGETVSLEILTVDTSVDPATISFAPLPVAPVVTGADGRFSFVMPANFIPDPNMAVVSSVDYGYVNDVTREVMIDERSSAIINMIADNDFFLFLPAAYPAWHFTPSERLAIETTLRAATTELNFFTLDPVSILLQIDADIFSDASPDELDVVANSTFAGAAQSPGQGTAPIQITGTVAIPGNGGTALPLAGVSVDLGVFRFSTACGGTYCIDTIPGMVTTTNASGQYSFTVPGFMVPGLQTAVVVGGDLSYNAGGTPGVFVENLNIVSLGGFFTHAMSPVANIDVAGAVVMGLLSNQGVPIANFNPDETAELLNLVRSKIPTLGTSVNNKTLQQVMFEIFNALLADAQVTSLVDAISDPEPTGLSRVIANPATLQADGYSLVEISIEPLNELAQQVGPGKVITLTSSLGSITSPAVDNGDGTYSAWLTAPVTQGSATVRASMEGQTFDQQPLITFTPDTTAPANPDTGAIRFINVGSTTTVLGLPGAAEPGSRLTFTNVTDGGSVTIQVNADGSFRADINAQASDQISLQARDAAGNNSANVNTTIANGLTLPAIANPQTLPNPAAVQLSMLAESSLGVAVPTGFSFVAGFNLNLQTNVPAQALDVLVQNQRTISPSQQIVLAQVLELQAGPRWRFIGPANNVGGILFPAHDTDFPGVLSSGRYAYLATSQELAYVYGNTAGLRGPVQGALASLANNPFVDLTRVDGRYLLAGVVGTADTASVQLMPHSTAQTTGVQLPFAQSQTRRDFSFTTRMNLSYGHTARFVGDGEVARSLHMVPGGRQLYKMNNAQGDLAVIDTASLVRVSLVNDVQTMNHLLFTPNGVRGMIGYFNRVRDYTVAIEELGRQITNLGFPQRVTITPDGELALGASSLDNNTTDSDPDAVFVSDTFTNIVEAVSLPIPADPGAIIVNHAGTRAYVVSRTQGTLTVIDIPNRAVITSLTLGTDLADIAIDYANAELYVADFTGNQIQIIDTLLAEDAVPGNELITVVPVGATPNALALSPDGQHLLVAERDDDTVSQINVALRAVNAVWGTVDAPFSLAMQPTGTHVYVLDPLTRRGIMELPLAASDSTNPRVVDAGPQDRTQRLLQDSPVEFVFDERMDVSTFTFDNIQVLDATFTLIPGSLAPSVSGTAAVFTPAAGVRYVLNSQLNVQLGAGLTDAAGNNLVPTIRTVPTQIMQLPNITRISVDLTTDGIIANGQPGAVEPGSVITITNLTSGEVFLLPPTNNGSEGVANIDGSFTLSLRGLDENDGFQLVTSIFGGRATTDPILLPVNFSITPPNPALVTYEPGPAGTLRAVGAAGAVDPQTTRIEIHNVTSGARFSTETINPDGSFSINILARSSDQMAVIATVLTSVVLDPVGLPNHTFIAPILEYVTPDRFPLDQPATITIVGNNFPLTPGNILLEVNGQIRTDFLMDQVTGTDQPAIQLTLTAGMDSGSIRLTFAGQRTNDVFYTALPPQIIGDRFSSLRAQQIAFSDIIGDPNDLLNYGAGQGADLGPGGTVIVRLGRLIKDYIGKDLAIYENTIDGADCYEVSVSLNQTGPFNTLGQHCGSATIDLAGNSPVLYVKIVDANDGGNAAKIFMISAIRAPLELNLFRLDADGNRSDVVPPAATPAQSSGSGISGPAYLTVIAPDPDDYLCQQEEVNLEIEVLPPEPPKYYGPQCNDDVKWLVSPERAGRFEETGKYTAKFIAANLQSGEKKLRAQIRAEVTRSGEEQCRDTGETVPVNVDIVKSEFTITMTAHLPFEWVPGLVEGFPLTLPELQYDLFTIVYGGDGYRGFDCALDANFPGHGNYRMQQQVKVEACKWPQGGQRIIGNTNKDVGFSNSYNGRDAIANCTYPFNCDPYNPSHFLRPGVNPRVTDKWSPSDINDCTLEIRSDKSVRVNCSGGVGNPIPGCGDDCGITGILGAPTSDWNLNLSLTIGEPQPSFTLSGGHDGMPAYELCLGEQQIDAYMPPGGSGIDHVINLLRYMYPPDNDTPYPSSGSGQGDINFEEQL